MRNSVLRGAVACVLLLVVFALAHTADAQTTGRIDGTVSDAVSGEPLPGVNVVIAGTQQGAVTDSEGYYSIVGVRAGGYTLSASFIGYTTEVVEGVRVNVGLTTTIEFELQDEAVGLDEVSVVAERPIVQRDISANVANLTAEEIENLPVLSVEGVVGLQAGIEPGLEIRGGGLDQAAIIVDGLSMTDGRTATPYTGVSYTSVSEIQVQTGGFSAEYGDLRSGLINIVTKEGPRDRYIADVIMRYSPPTQKWFGHDPSYANEQTGEYAYWMRPYLDPDVADEGSGSGAWDQWTREQYPSWQGWDAVRNSLAEAGIEATNDELRQVYRYLTRKDNSPRHPDYEIDASIGGPIPGGSALGNLRFMASYRQTQREYLFANPRETYLDQLGQVKLNADLGQGTRLALQGMYSVETGINYSSVGNPGSFDRAERVPFSWITSNRYMDNRVHREMLFDDWTWMPSQVDRFMLGGEFTHMVSNNAFFTARFQRFQSDYDTRWPRPRSPEIVEVIGPFELDEKPMGWEWRGEDDPVQAGIRTGGHRGEGRDWSTVVRWTSGVDFTSQVNRYMQVKSGIEFIYSDYDVYNAEHDSFFVHHSNPVYEWRRQPTQGAAYGQAKLEFQGMVANLGARLDYFHAGGDWWVIEDPYHQAFSPAFGASALGEGGLQQEPTRRLLNVSPRIGISFPITEGSKLFFNYGHMRQMPNPHDLFIVEEINTGAVGAIGNPNYPLAQTVSYEIGYEHNLFDMFLLRLGGYYNDQRNQVRNVRYTNLDGQVSYTTRQPLNYGDVRGLEVTLTKSRGNIIRGFANFTYLSRKGGNFGFGQIYENRIEQRAYEMTSTDHYQTTPIPEPFSHFNLEVRSPTTFGPDFSGLRPLANWRVNLLGQWRSGVMFTFNGEDFSPEGNLQNNMRWKNHWMFDLRFSRTVNLAGLNLNLFMDVNNVFNLRQLRRGAFTNQDNQVAYLQSLHLPENTFEDLTGDPYVFVAGNDKPGDYRPYRIDFVPILAYEGQSNLPETGQNRLQGHVLPDGSILGPLYYVRDSGQYLVWDGSSYQQADPSHVDWVLENKAYIHMPWEQYRAFMPPRNVFFGMRFSF